MRRKPDRRGGFRLKPVVDVAARARVLFEADVL
jgi:hypothetical protein